MGRPTISVEGFWDRPLHELFELLPATPAGLTTEEARRRLRLYGPNSLVHELASLRCSVSWVSSVIHSSSSLSLPAAYPLRSESTWAG